MTPARINELTRYCGSFKKGYEPVGLGECLDEIELLNAELNKVLGSPTLKLAAEVARARQSEIKRLENITTIQQKQIERLMDARDAERMKCEGLLKDLEKADSLLKALEKQAADFCAKEKP
jgi:hypothetical protein